MKSFPFSLGKSKQNKFVSLATSAIAALALVGGVNAANATSIKVLTEKELTSESIPYNQKQPVVTQSVTRPIPYQAMGIEPLIIIPVIIIGGCFFFGGLVVIGEREVGIVVKKFTIAGKGLPPGSLIALNREAGLQADTLTPGWHWGYWPWQYAVKKEAVIVVPQGQIALVVAADGASNPPERILGKIVECDNFQDARKFLTNGGEKGRQIAFITAGSYRINTALFKVITSANASSDGMRPEQLRIYEIAPEKVGIVTTLDGLPIAAGEIAGRIIPGHNNFQNGQKFIDAGGQRGLQEQVLLSGSWNLNPWLVNIEQVPMTEIPIGYVGVVISFVGEDQEDVSGASFTHGNLVNQGHKGVWVEPLYPGKHPLNTKVMKVELVPTTNIVLNFTDRISGQHGYDTNLKALKLLSFDGFSFDLEIFQIIHIGASDAPKVISRLGSMQNVIDQVLRPIVGNYFRNSAQEYTILDFLIARSERQVEASEYVKTALRAYDVQAVDSLIGLITPPQQLMHTLTDRKIAEEQRKTYEVQQMAETQRQMLVRETALADIQEEMVEAEQNVQIAELKSQAAIKEANGEAEATKLKNLAKAEGILATGNAKAETYRTGVQALSLQGYTAVQLMQIVGDRNVRIIPDIIVGGNNGSNNGLADGLLSMILLNQTNSKTHLESKIPTPPPLPNSVVAKPESTNHNS
ncbi:flotillin family protein [Dolichospermum sp. ST_sed1]|nr:flotillin family protein [Dolichospermum sp. ST_sed1]MDD1422933.1 flotillin family protein [Dolichospermum sp. ST_sed9]MDD1430883.1 flotillin family protein [Dolichospermum sp. ST_sed6]MDD1435235.1 flotillin family protein [Dolichospermum sp. ST_sed10]MDD1439996.1 flotillin family protein [Dolichospermum sp. ST_sed3]MDD1446632.1 flotillin family protein [Dolichospermum sp. ST_sed8]MDD1454417.1 flotillin family protein [Dolichospermum sp. ST_sed7]MDD1458529.1 flotillin family protein [Doli